MLANRAGDGVGAGVGDGQMPMRDAQLPGEPGAFAAEAQDGLARGVVEDFHVGPGDFAAPAGAEDFEDGLFGGEAAGEMDGEIAMGEAIGLLGGGEAAVQEMPAVVGVHLGDAGDFRDIHAVSDDGHGGIVGYGWWRGKGTGGAAAREGRD